MGLRAAPHAPLCPILWRAIRLGGYGRSEALPPWTRGSMPGAVPPKPPVGTRQREEGPRRSRLPRVGGPWNLPKGIPRPTVRGHGRTDGLFDLQ